MASAWGKAFGISWGVSWGEITHDISTKNQLGIGWSAKQRHIKNDDSLVMEIIFRCAVKTLNSDLHSHKTKL